MLRDGARWNELVGLLHGRATRYLYEAFPGQDHASDEAAALAKRGNELARLFAAPVAVGTIFSVIRLLFATRGPERLLVSFSGARIVVDEIHAYQPEVTAMALACFQFLAEQPGAVVLMMSATVPQHLERVLTDALGVRRVPEEQVCASAVRHRLALAAFDSQSDEALEAILGAAGKGSVLVVVNQVGRAIHLWSRLRDRSATPPRLLHSRFHSLDRSEIESKLKPEPGVILVATQAVEVSLDLDFDRCFTELAPIESIVQRFGRCNRRGRQVAGPAPVRVFAQFPDGRSPHLPYDETHIARVRSVLEAYCDGGERPFGDGDVQSVLDDSYPEDLKERLRAQIPARIETIRKLFIDEWQPLGSGSRDQCRDLEEQWEKLFDGKEVLPERFVGEAVNSSLWAGTARYLVPISERQFQRLRNAGEIEDRRDDLGCFVIRRPYDKAGLSLSTEISPLPQTL